MIARVRSLTRADPAIRNLEDIKSLFSRDSPAYATAVAERLYGAGAAGGARVERNYPPGILASSPRFAVIACIVLSLAGCATHVSRIAPWCTAAKRLAAPLSITGLAGSYDLAFTATAGPHRDRTALGELQLMERDSSMRVINTVFGTIDSTSLELYFGAANIDLRSVGAFTEGSVASSDPAAPGVVLRVLRDSASLHPAQLGLGSDHNRRDILILDGASTFAEVVEATPLVLRGKWESGVWITTYRASGFFCARRKS